MRFYGIRGILSVPQNMSVEFFQFHGIRGNWWNLAAHFHGMPWNFYITSGSTILPSFFKDTTAFTKKFRPNTPRQYSTEFHYDSMAYLQTGSPGSIEIITLYVFLRRTVSTHKNFSLHLFLKNGQVQYFFENKAYLKPCIYMKNR